MYVEYIYICFVNIFLISFLNEPELILFLAHNVFGYCFVPYIPTPPLGQDMTQGQILSEV